jgi:RNA polymerase sigma-70 factor, ECF subfamily
MTTIHQPHRPTAAAIPELGAGPLARLRAGDRAAFGDLYRHTADRLTRYVAARLADRDRDAVDDLVQEAFCTALADPRLLGEHLLGSMLRLLARAVTAHHWSQRRYLRAAHTVYQDRTGEPAPVAFVPGLPRSTGRPYRTTTTDMID